MKKFVLILFCVVLAFTLTACYESGVSTPYSEYDLKSERESGHEAGYYDGYEIGYDEGYYEGYYAGYYAASNGIGYDEGYDEEEAFQVWKDNN